MQRYAIVGLGMVTGPQPGKTARLLETEAARLAIEDAGLERSQVNGAIQLPLVGGAGDWGHSTDAFPRVLGLPVDFYCSVYRGGSPAAFGIVTAMSVLDRGIADYVVLSHGQDHHARLKAAKDGSGRKGLDLIPKEGYWGKPFGDSQAAAHHTFFASRHMHEYGTKPEHFGAIAVQTRAWAQQNPRARFYGQPITLQDYMNAPFLVEPYRGFDMSIINDGAVAFVMTTAERAGDLPQPVVWVCGVGFGEAGGDLWWKKQNYTALAVKPAKAQAFRQAGIGLEDIDCAQLFDCFTAETLFQLEDYGWCDKGEGGPFAAEGRIGPGGDMPVNTSGGLLSAYHFADLTGFSEAVLQLRGKAGERQVPDCRHVLVSGHGGEMLSPGMCSMHSTLILGNS